MKVSQLCAISLLLLMAASAEAQVIFSYSGGSNRTDGGQVVGATFTSFGQTLNSLGFFDFGGDGIATSYQLGLWDSAQNLVASTTVTPASPLIDDFRYAPIPSITIGSFANPEQFTIGVLLPEDLADVWLDNALLTLGAGFSGAGTGQFTVGGSLVYPATFDSSPYVVVNASPVVVPEPSAIALALLGAAGLSVLGGRARRRA